MYYPLAQIPGEPGWYNAAMNVVVRTRLADPAAVVPEVRRILTGLDPEIAVENAETMQDVLDRSLGIFSFLLLLLAGAAVAALTLAVVGVYGLVAYLVARRSNEIGIRLALGALPRRVRLSIVAATLKLLVVGLAVGLLASLATGAALSGLLFGVAPTNPLVYLAGAATLASATVLASWFASGRAAGIAPMDALRIE